MLQGRGDVAFPPAQDRQCAQMGQPQAPVLAHGLSEPFRLLACQVPAAAAQQGLHLQVAVQCLGALCGRIVPEPRGPVGKAWNPARGGDGPSVPCGGADRRTAVQEEERWASGGVPRRLMSRPRRSRRGGCRTPPGPAWSRSTTTALAVTDARSPGRPVVYLNGSFASQRHWRSVIAELGPDWRRITAAPTACRCRPVGPRRLRDKGRSAPAPPPRLQTDVRLLPRAARRRSSSRRNPSSPPSEGWLGGLLPKVTEAAIV